MTYSAEIVHANTRKPLRIRSAATRGKRMFTLGGKASSSWGLRMADLVDLHAADLGGPEYLSEAELSFIRRASAMECQVTIPRQSRGLYLCEPLKAAGRGR